MRNIKAKKSIKINEKTLITTIDIGKVVNTGYCRCPDGTDNKPFKFYNNGEGFKTFWGIIQRFKEQNKMEEIIVGFESTGAYAQPLMEYLRKRDVQLVQVNPMHTKRVKELCDNSPNKTDNKDPRVIADIIQLGHFLTVVIPEGIVAELRRLTQARERSVERQTALFNQLQELVSVIFPEFLSVMDVKTKTAKYLLEHYPTPESILECGLESLVYIIKKVSKGKIGKQRVEVLYNASKESVGIKEGRESILFEIKHILSLIEIYKNCIFGIENKMKEYLKQVPESKYILSIKGIKVITACGIIGEVGDFSKFKTAYEIEKLAGLNLYEISSGKHIGERHISKRGRALLRKILFYASLNVVRKGGIYHSWYQNSVKGGMPKKKALIAVSRKLIKLIFALVHRHSEYKPQYYCEELKKAA